MKNRTLLIVLAVLLIMLVAGISTYNGMVAANERIDNKWGDINTQLQRRSDLIPNLVTTTKAYATQEKEIFTQVAEARSKLAGANSVGEKAQADAELSTALSRLLVVVERYPALKSDANFRQLADELAGTENRLAVARRDYNEAVRDYNTRIKKFPANMIAGMGGFAARDYYKAQEGAQEVPQVNF
ncbi:LemA family protein [Syntrophomonas wolfei]|uniref:LemA protein n=1 Tax=Syntrophomonas wolfei subsp. wolfei (strain DSM 2245B / Goettingen) TaxID=335541 RepID=Q0AXR0_SYNWW|nr:LemA family protein [Syntrophomonas wolfei]ABI68494.1 lemA protein [Syntrophomonas wolfei subsp. wolfei str. Goettingen G311]